MMMYWSLKRIHPAVMHIWRVIYVVQTQTTSIASITLMTRDQTIRVCLDKVFVYLILKLLIMSNDLHDFILFIFDGNFRVN